MKLLLDTHALLWFAADKTKLAENTLRELESDENSVFFSCASIWEIAIKVSLRKLNLTISVEDGFRGILESNGLTELTVMYSHAARVANYPLHHHDPFDRLLVAQADIEQMTLVSKDAILDAYGIRRLW
ncbi:MAG TPA: type II toxin-antitoxin system VapC family toxin [Verrucomicrobiae bacterium]|nr:type II toxin-antitoxin system VapC family toxin [Verrucomicrobiae bacterium]